MQKVRRTERQGLSVLLFAHFCVSTLLNTPVLSVPRRPMGVRQASRLSTGCLSTPCPACPTCCTFELTSEDEKERRISQTPLQAERERTALCSSGEASRAGMSSALHGAIEARLSTEKHPPTIVKPGQESSFSITITSTHLPSSSPCS